MAKKDNWKKWIDPSFEGMTFNEIFGGIKGKKKRSKKVMADKDFDIGV